MGSFVVEDRFVVQGLGGGEKGSGFGLVSVGKDVQGMSLGFCGRRGGGLDERWGGEDGEWRFCWERL